MVRRLSSLLSAASLVLCVAVCALWVRSLWVSDLLRWGEPDPVQPRAARLTSVTSETGGLAFAAGVGGGPRDYQRLHWRLHDAQRYAGTIDHGFGFTASVRGGVTRLVVPHGFVALLLAALPVATFVRARRRGKRRAAGRCSRCGYDLRATPEKGGALLDRCPECGTAETSKAPQ